MPIPRILEIMATCPFDCWSSAWEKEILYHLPLTATSDYGDDHSRSVSNRGSTSFILDDLVSLLLAALESTPHKQGYSSTYVDA